jgi:hypothetical protein
MTAAHDCKEETMLRRCLVAAAVVGLFASPAFAQPRIEFSGLAGYTFSEGIDIVGTPGLYNRIDPAAGFSFALTFGAYIGEQGEIEFLYSRQASTLEITGGGPQLNGDMAIRNYMGNFVYNFGDESMRARPFAFVGLGATQYGDAVFASQAGLVGRTIPGVSKFSWALGGGVKGWASHNVGFKGMFRWVPTYISTSGGGWWCDPWYGCSVYGNVKYSNQFELSGGIVARF